MATQQTRFLSNIEGDRIFPISSTTDGNGTGDVVFFGSGTLVAGNIYFYDNTGVWDITDAQGVASSTGLLAVAKGTLPRDGMILRGMATLATDPGTVGDPLYLLAGGQGEASSTPPSSSGEVVRLIGHCLDSTNGQIWFNPDNIWIEIA
jgi:hypothetical protein